MYISPLMPATPSRARKGGGNWVSKFIAFGAGTSINLVKMKLEIYLKFCIVHIILLCPPMVVVRRGEKNQ